MLTRKDFLAKWRDEITDLSDAYTLLDQILDEHELQLKTKDEEIERLKEAISISIEEIEYALRKPYYTNDYLSNAVRFLKEQ